MKLSSVVSRGGGSFVPLFIFSAHPTTALLSDDLRSDTLPVSTRGCYQDLGLAIDKMGSIAMPSYNFKQSFDTKVEGVDDSMRALRFHGQKDIRLDQIPIPNCGKGQVKVKPAFVGICGTGESILKISSKEKSGY